MPQDIALETTLPATGPALARRQTGLAASKNGKFAEARKHLFAALEFHPSSPDLLLDLVCACADDPDALAQWTERYVRAASDQRGRMKMGTPTRNRLKPLAGTTDLVKQSKALTTKRTAAIAELARFITRQKAKGKETATRALMVRWASELLLLVGEGAPQALASVASNIDKHQASFEPDYDVIYAALAKVMRQQVPNSDEANNAPTTGAPSDAQRVNDQRIRAARILVGLWRQQQFKDLKGPRPDGPGSIADDARQLLESERKHDVEAEKIWTIAELEGLSKAEALRFTETHRDWHHPGLALSTTGRYRIETICGHETLLGTAKTIELHHERLVNHYGKDPFVNRQGVARIVPEHSDLETEGAPYWWAAGFQSGDRTTIRFAWNTIPALGKTLTHELTHRFDGVIRPFLPTWYVEGHADWTSGHYAKMRDTKFLKDYLKKGTAAHTYYKGYAGKKQFEKLLNGKVDDYRDNYFAGYSLYTFLLTYPPESPRYKDALPKFERNARAGQRNPLGYFTSTFCDGKEGRPSDFDELHKDWSKFVRGCYDWLDRKRDDNKWLHGYRGDLGPGDNKFRKVKDEPTWSWSRVHAEPFYGQEHAATATLLLDEVGDVGGTIASGVWSLTADGWRPEIARTLTKALTASRSQDAAKAFGAIARDHFPEIMPADGSSLLATLPKTKALLAAITEHINALDAGGQKQAAAAMAREHAAMTRRFSMPAHDKALSAKEPRLPRHLGSKGFSESELTGFEDRRKKGLWYSTAEGDLHVGRNKPREGTGVLDRKAHQRDAFAHSVMWLAPGHYVLRGHVHWTTSYVSGAIVLGHTRRDRSIRIPFSAGDFQYATGKSETNDRLGRVRFRLQGLWQRDGQLPNTRRSQSIEIPENQNWFAYELHVRGPRVEVIVNDEPLMRYAVHDGTPIEGHVGFATSTGAIRVQLPTLQRLDDEVTSPTVGLDITRQPTVPLADLMQLQTRGLPRNQDGTLVLWLPAVDEGSPGDGLGRAIRQLSRVLQKGLEYPQPWVLAVPHDMEAKDRKNVIADLQDLREMPLPIIEHRIGMPFDDRYPWVLFLDSQGVLRAAANSRDTGLTTKVAKWSAKFRGR